MRLRCFVRQLCEQLDGGEERFELVLVDWHPPPESASLHSCLRHIDCPANLAIRVVEVPASVHHTLENSHSIALFEYIAKNVGVRRASGHFILATNPDILFSADILAYLCGGRLREDGFYRADRHEFEGQVSELASAADNLRTAAATVSAPVVYRPQLGHRVEILDQGPVYTAASGDFWLAHRSVWRRIGGYLELTTSSHMDSILCHEAVAAGFKQYVLPSPMKIYHMAHSRADRLARPRTDLAHWREVVEANASRVHRGNWGLADLDLTEQRLGLPKRTPATDG